MTVKKEAPPSPPPLPPPPPPPPPSSPPSSSSNPKAHHVAIAASGASFITKFLLYPLDTVKSRVQNYTTAREYAARARREAPSGGGGGGFPRAGGDPPRRARGSLAAPPSWGRREALFEGKSALWQGVRHEYAGRWRPRDLYGGFALKTTLYVPYQLCYQNGYHAAATLLRVEEHRERGGGELLWRVAACAVAAEFASFTLRIPIETMKLRIQTRAAKNAAEAVRQLRQNGLRASGRLFLPQTIVHDIPYSVIQWVMYETLRIWAMSPPSSASLSASAGKEGGKGWTAEELRRQFPRVFLSGALSGLIASTLTIPLDNIRTRVTVATARNPTLRMRSILRTVCRADGIRALFHGGAMRTLCVTANMAIYFPIFELGKKLLA